MRALVAAFTAVIIATALVGPADAAVSKRDRAACHRTVSGNPSMMVNGHRTRSYGPAMRRCMTGQAV
jgi:hypothetical protein